MLFVDPDKLDALTDASLDILNDVREARGLKIVAPKPDRDKARNMTLAFLALLSGIGPIHEGGTQYVIYGDETLFFPPHPVRFAKGAT